MTKTAERGLALTESEERLLSYGRKLIEPNDETIGAMCARNLEGCVRVGFQEDFGECILPSILGRFARTHPKVHIEGRITRNKELREKVANGQLDIALAWSDSSTFTHSEKLADIPLCWQASRNGVQLLEQTPDATVPLKSLYCTPAVKVDIMASCYDKTPAMIVNTSQQTRQLKKSSSFTRNSSR